MNGVKLGEIPFYGKTESRVWAYHLRLRTRGGQGQDRGHPKPPSSSYHTRFEELSQARWILTKIQTKLCKGLQATHHPSLQIKRLHRRQRREADICDAESITN